MTSLKDFLYPNPEAARRANRMRMWTWEAGDIDDALAEEIEVAVRRAAIARINARFGGGPATVWS